MTRPPAALPRPGPRVPRAFRRLLVLALAPVALAAAPVDLDPGLAYLRVPELAGPDHLGGTGGLGGRPLVLDLRHTRATPAGADALRAALATRPASTPLFILVAPGTPASLAAALDPLPPGVLTLGVRTAVPAPRLVVAQAEEADRRAVTALDAGAAPATLVSGKVSKERFDEASLVREFADGRRTPSRPAATPAAPAPAADPALVDRVLQRAIHLHRTLGAVRPRA